MQLQAPAPKVVSVFSGSRLRLLLVGVLVVVLAGTATYAYRHRPEGPSNHGFNPAALPPVTEVSTAPTPSPVAAATPAPPTPSPSPSPLPPSFRLGVPYTTQAPLVDWPKHQESCEEATLAMVAAFWSGARQDTIDPHAADKTINDLVAWQVKNWGSEDDLTDVRLGELAKAYYGYRYSVLPISETDIERQLVAGRPVVLGVTTHGLGNPNYPHYQDHKLQLPYDVSHFLAIVGYDSQGFILNDPGITLGHGYHVTYTQLLFAIDDLDAKYPKLNEGHVMLVIQPAA